MVKAFTLIELVVALLLGAILTGIIFYSYLLFTKQFRQYQKNTSSMNEYLLFRTALEHDMESCDFVLDSLGSFYLLSNDKNRSGITYAHDEQQIVRSAGIVSDTFRLGIRSYETSFKNDTTPLVENIFFVMNVDSYDLKPVFTKRYSARQLMWFENTLHE